MDISRLKGKVPDSVISQIPGVGEKFDINTALRLAHFLAQCSHESNGFKATIENLNYSAAGLVATFKKYFPTEAAATPYARNQQKIANKVYASRMGNGDEASGDGYRYRGRGYIQLTGKNNYGSLAKAIGVDVVKDPDLVATAYPLMSAAWFFSTNGLCALADAGATDDVVVKVTKRVNGGTIGLEDRLARFKEYYALLK